MTESAIENAWRERRKWLYSKQWENRKRAKRAGNGKSKRAGTTSTAEDTKQHSQMLKTASVYAFNAIHNFTELVKSPSYKGCPICQNYGHGANARTRLCDNCYVCSHT